MSLAVSQTTITNFTNNENISEFITTLTTENERLKTLNEKLHKKTLNQKRKILRLKKLLNNTDNEESFEPDNIYDNVWEDVEKVIASYDKTKTD
jgi:hypothetical protein